MTEKPGPIPDPMNMFRDVVNQWEKLANDYGSQFLARPEAAQAMHSVTAAGLQVQNAVQDAMAKVLTAANMPSNVAAVAETKAMRIEIQAASSNGWFDHSATYQRVENPPQTVTRRESLKLKITRIRIGR